LMINHKNKNKNYWRSLALARDENVSQIVQRFQL